MRLAFLVAGVADAQPMPQAVRQPTDSLSVFDRVLPAPQAGVHDLAAAPFNLPPRVAIVVAPGSSALREIAEQLAATLRARTGHIARVTTGVTTRVNGTTSSAAAAPANIPTIRLDTTLNAANAEAYALHADAAGISINGASSAGARWGTQTLLQLLERVPSTGTRSVRHVWRVPAVRITDAPRFAWRGSMLDVGRHLLTVRDIERHIDLLSRYKMNVLHWHLTEDQGWRIEITRYPRLTSVGAWRRERDGSRYGGFFSQQQVRGLVEYARVRGVTIVPEIEIPGHSSAAIAAYPDLGCTNDTIPIPTTWGVFADIYCAGKEGTFTFLFGVLDEVMALFPSPVIHIGGDEAPKERWRDCAACQAVMRREGLKNEEELQSWFMRRIAEHVAKRGRRVIGWDEVLDGPYVPGGMVQSWRDSSFTRIAAQRGHDVIASPSDFTYLNRSAAELTLRQVYAFDPMPPGLDSVQQARVLGGEVPFWSEHITSGANLELMAIPRLLAFAEVLWSPASRDAQGGAGRDRNRDADRFVQRVESVQLPALRADRYAVGPAAQALVTTAVAYDSASRRARLRVPTLAKGIVVRGTTNGARPLASSPVFTDGSVIGAGTTRLQAFFGNQAVREERRVTLQRHAAVGATVRTMPNRDDRYPGTGAYSLVDGLLGSSDHGDGLWQGWWVPDVEILLELPMGGPVDRVDVNFLQNVRSWIVLPRTVEFSFLNAAKEWSTPVVASHAVPATREGAIIQSFGVPIPAGPRPRVVRIHAKAGGPLPTGHPGAGQAHWLFADEVRVTPRR
jgi:hexosaminidase